MNTPLKILITVMPIVAYLITLLVVNESMKKRIPSRTGRKLPLRYIQRDINWIFVPLFAGSVLLVSVLTGSSSSGSGEKIVFILKVAGFIISIAAAFMAYRKLRIEWKGMKSMDEERLNRYVKNQLNIKE